MARQGVQCQDGNCKFCTCKDNAVEELAHGGKDEPGTCIGESRHVITYALQGQQTGLTVSRARNNRARNNLYAGLNGLSQQADSAKVGHCFGSTTHT